MIKNSSAFFFFVCRLWFRLNADTEKSLKLKPSQRITCHDSNIKDASPCSFYELRVFFFLTYSSAHSLCFLFALLNVNRGSQNHLSYFRLSALSTWSKVKKKHTDTHTQSSLSFSPTFQQRCAREVEERWSASAASAESFSLQAFFSPFAFLVCQTSRQAFLVKKRKKRGRRHAHIIHNTQIRWEAQA